MHIVIFVLLLLAITLLYFAFLDGSYRVRRSLKIAAPRKVVFDKIRDFRSWHTWSPWLMHEPETRLEFSDNSDEEGGWYTWDGKQVGAGKLSHVTFIGIEKIDQQIEFTRPFKSICRVWWEFEQIDNNTTLVHWNMEGKMPFFFRFMAKKMPEYIGKDYDTGLYLLRGELVEGVEAPRLSFDGVVELPDQTTLAIPFEGYLEEMKEVMNEAFPRLGHYLDKKQITAAGPPFTVYNHVDVKAMHFVCDMAFPVPADTRMDDSDPDLVIMPFSGGRYYKVTMQGSYAFLELAWYQAYNHLQMLKMKPQMRRASLEMYENDPNEVAHTNEIVTSLYIPVK